MDYLKVESQEQITTIYIDRPQALNALNTPLLLELQGCIDKLETDQQTRVISIRGRGQKAFAAGADIKEFQGIDAAKGVEISAVGHRLFEQMESFRIPIIAAIEGYALGGGLELAMACHIRVCNTSARLGLPEVNLGLMPGYGGSTRLPELVGKSMAMRMMLSGDLIDSSTALASGLVSDIFEDAVFDESLLKLQKTIASKAPLAQQAIISISQRSDIGRKERLQMEQRTFGQLMETEDCREGIEAFVKKRKALFVGK